MRLFNTIDSKELDAASSVIDDAKNGFCALSCYIGSSPTGGPKCVSLEWAWQDTFEVRHAVAVNSGTSGLLAACMAVGIEHGDEVIVSPYTMSATAAAPKLLGAKLVWADIEPDTFTIDPVEVSNLITSRTRAVIATNLFGHPAHLRELRDICDSHGVYLIEDNAQAIFAREHGIYTGTIGHIGVFSLNVHKQLQVGEGGICVTNSDRLGGLLREAMNHGEMRGGILGLNLRMTEVTAAMAREQLVKGPEIIKRRIEIGEKLNNAAAEHGLMWPMTRNGCTHSHYAWASYLFDEPKQDIPAPFKRGYLHPLYSLPAFKTKETISLPVVESIEKSIVLLETCSIDPTDEEIVKIIEDLGRAL